MMKMSKTREERMSVASNRLKTVSWRDSLSPKLSVLGQGTAVQKLAQGLL